MIDHAPGLERLLAVQPVEGSFELQRVSGTVPARLRGRSYMNGPALFERPDFRYRHWLDGDGLLTSVRFRDGRAQVSSRFVASDKRREEAAAGRPLFRAFGTSFAGDRLRRGFSLQSPVNVSVYPWDGRLLAFGEQGLPWEIDPETLETRGEYRFAGGLNEVSPLSAHPAVDHETHELVDFGISYSASEPVLHLYRFRDGALAERSRYPLPYPCSTHDFALSERHAVLFLSPHLMDVRGLLEQGKCVQDCLSWNPELGSKLLVIDRREKRQVALIDVGRGYCLHLANAFDRAQDSGGSKRSELVVDLIEIAAPIYDSYTPMPELFVDEPAGEPVRYVIDLETATVRERTPTGYRATPDFPAIDPRRSQRAISECWMLGLSKAGQKGRKFFDELAHVSFEEGRLIERYRAPVGSYLGGEPIFLPDPDHGRRGWVLCQELAAGAGATPIADFLLFDAHRIAAGPIARLRMPHPIPPGFHAAWSAG